MTPTNEQEQKQLVIYGAGGHGLVVAEAAVAAGWHVLGFVDDDANRKTAGLWSMLDDSVLQSRGGKVNVIVAIGDNEVRQKLAEDIQHQGCKLVSITHPLAWVSPSANVGPGVFIGAGAAVQAEAHVDHGVIINTGAIVEHHCTVGAFTHIAPKATLGGRARVGMMCLVGIGATVRPDVCIGDHCTIGGGAMVASNIDNNQTVMGVPARPR